MEDTAVMRGSRSCSVVSVGDLSGPRGMPGEGCVTVPAPSARAGAISVKSEMGHSARLRESGARQGLREKLTCARSLFMRAITAVFVCS